jgi:hypothetical protein
VAPIASTRHCGHQYAYCASPGWLWWWRNLWNDNWQEKPKYSEKTCPSAGLSTTNPSCSVRTRTRAAALGSQGLTAWATARQTQFLPCDSVSSELEWQNLTTIDNVQIQLFAALEHNNPELCKVITADTVNTSISLSIELHVHARTTLFYCAQNIFWLGSICLQQLNQNTPD